MQPGRWARSASGPLRAQPWLPLVEASEAARSARAPPMRRTSPSREEREDERSLRNPFRACGRIVRLFDRTAVPRRHADADAKDVPYHVGVGEHVVSNVALLEIEAV